MVVPALSPSRAYCLSQPHKLTVPTSLLVYRRRIIVVSPKRLLRMAAFCAALVSRTFLIIAAAEDALWEP